MKKFIIAVLLATSSTYTFAEDFFTISGKKISLHEKPASMVAKLGNPSKSDSKELYWDNKGSPITATFGMWGLDGLTISKGSFTIDGKTIIAGKDTPNTVKSKLQKYCRQIEGGQASKLLMQTTRVGAEGEIYIIITTVADGGVSDKALMNLPVSSVELSYEDPLSNPTCNY